MSNYSDDDFDKFLYEEIKRAAEGIPAPDVKKAWAEFEGKLNALIIKRRRTAALKKVAAVAALAVILTGVLASFGNDAHADFRIFKTIKTLWGNVISIAGFTQTDTDAPQKDSVEEINRVDEKKLWSLNEAQETLDYRINVPEYIPKEYELSGAYIRNPDSRMSPVQLILGDMGGNNITIEQQPIAKPVAFNHSFRENDAQVKTIELNSFEATLIYFNKSGIRQLMWQSPTMYYTISGPLAEDEIIKVGLSVK